MSSKRGFDFDSLDDQPDVDEIYERKLPYMEQQRQMREFEAEIDDRLACKCRGSCQCVDASCSKRMCEVGANCRLGRYPRYFGIVPAFWQRPMIDCDQAPVGGYTQHSFARPIVHNASYLRHPTLPTHLRSAGARPIIHRSEGAMKRRLVQVTRRSGGKVTKLRRRKNK